VAGTGKAESAFERAHRKVMELAETFRANEGRYLSPNYQEAEVRKDFIDKFFIALGWDVNHDVQTNPWEQEVKVEPPVAASGQRRADYVFRLAPNFRDVRFFVEAKKPHGDLATVDNYFQTIRYAWNSETPLAVLTDFNQLHVLDCRFKPDIEDALNRHVAKYHYREYFNRDKFAEIYWLFSREAVASGSLEKRAKELPKPRGKAVQHGLFPGGYQKIDESFLEQLDEYRIDLARTFKSKNTWLDGETLTELVQRTLDRLVFLRFLEDKGIEPQPIVDRFGEKGTAWGDFVAASRRLDAIYNGVVFKQHAILDGDKFHVDDGVFGGICDSIAHVNSPYDFDAIPIYILGSIYERFLGNVIVATDKRVRVEPKPEVRKAGGVYYTPEYIVRYIVESTIGKVIAGKTPDQIAEMRFADISCGSGSFLLGVFDLLLIYHTRYYNDHPKKASKGDCIAHQGKLYLSLSKKREILLNNIFGVDLDAQAVEVCQLSLYLKLLQDETTGSTHQYLLDFAHAAHLKKLLPDLRKNIICGNSLIGSDFSDGELFPAEERRLNTMDFVDAFPEVIKRGGFDAIVGNPPYVQIENIPQIERDYFLRAYGENGKLGKRYDIYQVFVLRALSLLAPEGRFGYILPNTFLMGQSYRILRKRISEMSCIEECVDLPQGVFRGVTVDNVLLLLRRELKAKNRVSHQIQVHRLAPKSEKSRVETREWDESFTINQRSLKEDDDYRFNVYANPQQSLIFRKIESVSVQLGEITESSQGIILYKTEADAEKSKYTGNSPKAGWKKLLRGTNIGRYETKWGGEYVSYGPWLWCARDEKFFDQPKLLLQAMRNKSLARRLVATYDNEKFYNAHNLANIIAKEGSGYDLRYILGCFNSTLLNFWYKAHFPNVNINPGDFRKIPIRRVKFSEPIEKSRYVEMTKKVDAMLMAKAQFRKAKTDKDRAYYESRCIALDRQIDGLVYVLCGLTEEEIQIVEHTEETQPVKKESLGRRSTPTEHQIGLLPGIATQQGV
jgi:adenine-specific DNA-methyltransferase